MLESQLLPLLTHTHRSYRGEGPWRQKFSPSVIYLWDNSLIDYSLTDISVFWDLKYLSLFYRSNGQGDSNGSLSAFAWPGQRSISCLSEIVSCMWLVALLGEKLAVLHGLCIDLGDGTVHRLYGAHVEHVQTNSREQNDLIPKLSSKKCVRKPVWVCCRCKSLRDFKHKFVLFCGLQMTSDDFKLWWHICKKCYTSHKNTE